MVHKLLCLQAVLVAVVVVEVVYLFGLVVVYLMHLLYKSEKSVANPGKVPSIA